MGFTVATMQPCLWTLDAEKSRTTDASVVVKLALFVGLATKHCRNQRGWGTMTALVGGLLTCFHTRFVLRKSGANFGSFIESVPALEFRIDSGLVDGFPVVLELFGLSFFGYLALRS